MTLLYVLAGVYSGENPLDIIKNYGPAYLTAVGTMSSAATLAVALQCAENVNHSEKIWYSSVSRCLQIFICAVPFLQKYSSA